MSEQRFDVAVVGGGPAGLSAAIGLAERGAKVVVCETKRYPHDKMCGEFLSPECVELLARLGVMEQEIADWGAVRIERARISAPDGTVWEERLPGKGVGVSRRVLDAALANRARQAGVEVCERTVVMGVTGNFRDSFVLETQGAATIRARAVIGAHGKRSSFDRALGRAFLQQHHPYVALKAHFWGPPVPDRVELYGFVGGYCGISEIEGGARVVCLLAREEALQWFTHGKGNVTERFIEWMAEQNERLGDWLRHAERIHERWITIAQVAFCPKPAMEGDVLLAGDAAGLIVPLAGNGISMALEGGWMAAQNIMAFLNGEKTAEKVRREYPPAWKKRFGQRLQLGRMLQPLMLRPATLALALRTLGALPGFGRYLVKNTRG